MKQSFIILMLMIATLTGWLCYEGQKSRYGLESLTGVSLSDIAESVKAIPLKYTSRDKFDGAHSIRIIDNELFLISHHTLYRFNLAGDYVGQITRPDNILVAAYLVDRLNRRLIVFGNDSDVHYYSYDGNLVERREFVSDSPMHRIKAVEMYDNCIWTVESMLHTDSATQQKYMDEKLVKYDLDLNKIEQRTLASADLPGKPIVPSFTGMGIGVDGRSKNIYAYSSPLLPDFLLRDSLALKNRERMFSFDGDRSELCEVYPLRLGRRFWVASSSEAESNYIFCFDSASSRSWLVESMDDNFFRTGKVSALQPMDIYGASYYFCKSGDELKESFPQLVASGNAVVFVVQMKA